MADPPLKVYRGANVTAIVMLGLFVVVSVFIVLSAIIERNLWLSFFCVGFSWLALPFVLLRRAQVEVWEDRLAVRMWRRWREYRFDECSEFEAKPMPGLASGGLLVRFVHSPGGHISHPRSVRWFGYNTLIPRLRGGAPKLARELNDMRGRALSGDRTKSDPTR